MSVAEAEAREIQLEAPSGLWHEAFHRLIRNPSAIIGFVLVFLFFTAAVFAPRLATHDPLKTDLLAIADGCCPGPSTAHWLGVDLLGRDVFSRLLYGARYSLLIGVVSVFIGLSIGMVIGATAGYIGGIVDSVLMRAMDIMLAIPGLLFAIAIVAALQPGLWQIMVAVAARAVGVRKHKILASHILPNAVSVLIVQATLAMATAIIDVAGLAFLGLGNPDPATPEWGAMLTDVNEYLQAAPFLAVVPGLAIVLSVLGFNMIGDALREALDPKLRGRV